MLASAAVAPAQHSPAAERGILALASSVTVPSASVVLLGTALVQPSDPHGRIEVRQPPNAARWSRSALGLDAAWLGLGGATVVVGVLGFLRSAIANGAAPVDRRRLRSTEAVAAEHSSVASAVKERGA